VIYLYINALKM